MAKRIICALLAVVMLIGIVGCAKTEPEATPTTTAAPTTAPVEELDYTFGVNQAFHSETPVTYSIYFSDASWYPMVDTWKTEGIFKKIADITNVTLDLTSYDSGDYTNKITLDINSGSAKYIIPKVYDESAFVDGGAVVAVSDYAQYMPNYSAFIEEFKLQPDLNTIVRADGKYYRLPGLHESPRQDYTLMVRKDLFDAAGIDVTAIEKDWTWNDLYDALVKVKDYMVSQGTIKATDYIWSDLWAGTESGQNSGGNLLKLMGATYNVKSGWAVGNTMTYDEAKDEWYCSSISDDYKEFITMVNKFVKGGILDPETFTQDDTTAHNKFYNGTTAIMSTNESQFATDVAGLATGIGEGKGECYMVVIPKGNCEYTSESTRLENGVMISKNALDELGEDEFIKMMRFVDWLFYSDDAYTLTKWGVEGETYKVVDGFKELLPGMKCGGLGITGPDEDLDIRLQWGYAGGNYFYGHRTALRDDHLIPAIQDKAKRYNEYRKIKALEPAVVTNEDENEMLALWQTSLVDTVNTWTLQFAVGQKDITADWDAYVAACNASNLQNYLDTYNAAYKRG